ncbi:hypothetical protein AVEN_129944-1, partial [Araneus ventricosus]
EFDHLRSDSECGVQNWQNEFQQHLLPKQEEDVGVSIEEKRWLVSASLL